MQDPIVGTWLFHTSPLTLGESEDHGLEPFIAVDTFHAGGTFTETNSRLHTHSAKLLPEHSRWNATSGHGRWERRDAERYFVSFLKLLFDEMGIHRGFLRVVSTMTVDGDILRSEGRTEVFEGDDPDTAKRSEVYGTFEGRGRRAGLPASDADFRVLSL